jgi:hypothetical protein
MPSIFVADPEIQMEIQYRDDAMYVLSEVPMYVLSADTGRNTSLVRAAGQVAVSRIFIYRISRSASMCIK